MAFRLDIKPIAFIDIDEAIAWYENDLKGLGNRFLQNLNDAFEGIQKNPQHYRKIYGSVRRTLLKNFPYKVLFLIHNNESVLIIGVIHVKRSNRYLKKRLKK
jgi:toxin ParE1/3/4